MHVFSLQDFKQIHSLPVNRIHVFELIRPETDSMAEPSHETAELSDQQAFRHDDGMFKILIKTRNQRFQLGVKEFSLWTQLKLEVNKLKELQKMTLESQLDLSKLTHNQTEDQDQETDA